ncbi:leucine rich repeat containing protein 20 sclp isoform X2 [Leptinotarsa decemlineata]|uniref:leucine rich repeat containing protein 20 sclp isoform X2 n=1 Tax=Leptinotarsa decemlineata TaxID=7539 RepID=UPI000C252EE7|nr:leucine-rich repeat protein soc-2-like isoform X2 [Leptinotarsa decemlineata]
MASAVTRVIHRCEEAAESQSLDLSNCQLMQVPDAVYHLMRHTELKSCDLSDNVITKIPPKFATKFNLISDLNLSHNQMSKLPDECEEMGSLERLDISHNTFISLPNCIFKIPKLRQLNASNNHIVDIDVDYLRESSLESIDLSNNPIAPRIHEQLSNITNINVLLSPRKKEDWEDLTI